MDGLDDIFGNSSSTKTDDEIVDTTTTETEEQANEVVQTTEEVADEQTDTVGQQEKVSTQDDERKSWIPAALNDERAKRQAYEKEVEGLKRQIADMQDQQTKSGTPDPYDDPEGFAASLREEAKRLAEEQIIAYKIELSTQQAMKEHGEETVQKAVAWAREQGELNPALVQEFYQQTNPLEWVVQKHKRNTMLMEFEADPDGYLLKHAKERGLLPAETTQVALAQKQEASRKSPKSLASIPSAKSRGPAISGDDFLDIF